MLHTLDLTGTQVRPGAIGIVGSHYLLFLARFVHKIFAAYRQSAKIAPSLSAGVIEPHEVLSGQMYFAHRRSSRRIPAILRPAAD